MSAVNEILQFCPTDTGTNLETQSAYAADSNRTNGNQPGVASSKLNNKAIRQATYVASQLAQFLLLQNNMSVQDNDTPAQLLSQIEACLQSLPPNIQTITATGAFTYNLPYAFFIATGNATINATYTDGTTTFTVLATVASATLVYASGSAAPQSGGGPGTLTKTGGTGDATLTYYAFRAPVSLEVELVGPGGGGGGSTANDGTNGGSASTFGNLSSGAGVGGAAAGGGGGAGGTNTIGAGWVGRQVAGSYGQSGQAQSGLTINLHGGPGGDSYYGGGASTTANGVSVAAAANSGSGGAGGAQGSGASMGAGGGAGGFIHAWTVGFPSAQYTGSIGAKGTGGAAGGQAGSNGADGAALIIAHYQ